MLSLSTPGVSVTHHTVLFASVSFNELHTLNPWGKILLSYDLISKGYTKLYASLPSLAPPSAQEWGSGDILAPNVGLTKEKLLPQGISGEP